MQPDTNTDTSLPRLLYLAMHEGKKFGPFVATSMFDAHTKAVEAMKPRKSQRHMVSVHLIEKDGDTIIHTPTE